MPQAKRAPVKTPGRNGFKYSPRFGLILICRDERHQAELHTLLRRQGLKPRVVSV